MDNSYLMKTEAAREIYGKIKSLPICDYHCHLSPKEIYEDKIFENIGEMWLAVHFAKENIRVNAIAPGFFVTNQNRALLFNEDGTATPRTEKILRATPMGKFGEAQELLGAVEWLLNEEKAGFVTGVTIPIDGGFSAYSGV